MLVSPFDPLVRFAVVSASTARNLGPLQTEELAILSPAATAKRQRDFRLGRLAARQALEQLGYTPAPPVLKGPGREPVWPVGVVGAITHCAEFGAAAVTTCSHSFGLGIDLEVVPASSLPRPPVERVCLPEEMDWLAQAEDSEQKAVMLFSAKESIFKALYPLCKRYIGFKEVVCLWQADRQLFYARLLTDIAPEAERGTVLSVGCRYYAAERLVFTYLDLRIDKSDSDRHTDDCR